MYPLTMRKKHIPSQWPAGMLILRLSHYPSKYCFQPYSRTTNGIPVLSHQAKMPYQFRLRLTLKAHNLALLSNKPDFPKLLITIPVTFCCPTKALILFATVSLPCRYFPFFPIYTIKLILLFFTIYHVSGAKGPDSFTPPPGKLQKLIWTLTFLL